MSLSPLLFNIFISELIVYLKSFDLGIYIGGEKACILLYAEDIALKMTYIISSKLPSDRLNNHNKGNNKITELRAILQKESQNS